MGIFNFLFAKLSKKNNNEKNIESEKNIYQEIINFNDEKVLSEDAIYDSNINKNELQQENYVEKLDKASFLEKKEDEGFVTNNEPEEWMLELDNEYEKEKQIQKELEIQGLSTQQKQIEPIHEECKEKPIQDYKNNFNNAEIEDIILPEYRIKKIEDKISKLNFKTEKQKQEWISIYTAHEKKMEALHNKRKENSEVQLILNKQNDKRLQKELEENSQEEERRIKKLKWIENQLAEYKLQEEERKQEEKQMLVDEIKRDSEIEEHVRLAELNKQKVLKEKVRQSELKQLEDKKRQAEIKKQKEQEEHKIELKQKKQEIPSSHEQLNEDLCSSDRTNKSYTRLGVNKNEHNFSEVQLDMLRKLKSGTMSFLQINKKYLDEKFCLEAVKCNGHILNFIPKDILNLDICIEAVRNNINAMSYVPISLRNEINKVVDLEKRTMDNISSNNDDDDNIDIKELMEEGMPGKNPSYYSYGEIEHDGGSLYDQYEYIRDHMDN